MWRSKLLLVASMAEYGYLDGALTVYDTRTGETAGYRGIVDDQTINAVATHGTTAYLVTQIGSSGIDPTTAEARIAAFDLRTRRVLWETVPLPGVGSIRHLAHLDGLLYGTAGDRVFAFDPITRRVVQTAALPGAGGEIKAWHGARYAVTAERIVRLEPRTLATTVVADCLGAQWFNEPNLAIDADRDVAYTLTGRSVARAAP